MSQHFSDDLIMRHQPLAKSLASRFARGKNQAQMEDLVSIANVGLAKAAAKYRPDQGITFGAYAKTAAIHEIYDFLRSNKAPSEEEQQKLGEAPHTALIDQIAVEDQKLIIWKKRLAGALAAIEPREAVIFSARHLQEVPETLSALAAQFGISLERIRQIDVLAVTKVQQLIAQPWNGNAGRGPSLAERMQRKIEALKPAKDPADNVIRSAVVAVFGMSISPECAAMESRIRRTFKTETLRRERAKQQRARAKFQGLTWATGALSAAASNAH